MSEQDERAEARHIRMVSISWALFYFALAITLAIVLALTDNGWWNVPGIMSAYSGGHYLRKAWVRRKM